MKNFYVLKKFKNSIIKTNCQDIIHFHKIERRLYITKTELYLMTVFHFENSLYNSKDVIRSFGCKKKHF
jgi:hypothetical protein